MANFLERRLLLPYNATQIFDLVADIERYPEFVPGWREAWVTEHLREYLIVEQRVAVGPTDWCFVSEARFDRPHTIDINARDAPFGRFSIHWRFEALGETGCAVNFRARYHLQARILERLAGGFLGDRLIRIVDAFEDRARFRYGTPS